MIRVNLETKGKWNMDASTGPVVNILAQKHQMQSLLLLQEKDLWLQCGRNGGCI